jgi:hypothetical protein
VRNPIGQKIYEVDGLKDMLGHRRRDFATDRHIQVGPKCTDCHIAGIYDQTRSATWESEFMKQLLLPGPDLARTVNGLIVDDENIIKARVTNPSHPGGVTTLTDPDLTQQIRALRQFLDSTLASCP